MTFSKKTAKNLQVVLSVAAVASSLGSTASALAGPTASNLINLSNSGEVTVNNSLGQSFSLNGVISAPITPFAAPAAAGSATLIQTGAVEFRAGSGMRLGLNPLLGSRAGSFNRVIGQASAAAIGGVIQFRALSGVSLASLSGTQTVGAAISNTVFGPSNVKASSSFTNQTTTSLTAF